MSPPSLRRYRAERLLREQFDGLRGEVLASVRRRLEIRGLHLDRSDLEACYAHAWQGLYGVLLQGQEISNPAGWLVVVTFRRAIDEHRACERAERCARTARAGEHTSRGVSHGRRVSHAGGESAGAVDPDLAAELDDRVRIGQLVEGLRGRLNPRELEAASLCYLQGLPRSAAASRMGLSQASMRRLMDGRVGRPGVAGKVGAMVAAIAAGAWCEEQGSLMRGLAFGILDPAGERYKLALIHRDHCPACRAYVLSLRGLAAAIPPVPALAQLALGASLAPGAGASGLAGSSALRAGGAVSASGATGAGAAGSGWLLAGAPAGAKLAAGCVFALGLGAGCVVFGGSPLHGRPPAHARTAGAGFAKQPPRAHGSLIASLPGGAPGGYALRALGLAPRASAALTPTARLAREFGPESLAAGGSRSRAAAPTRSPQAARSASVTGSRATPSSQRSSPGSVSTSAGASLAASRSSAVPAALREFAPG